MEGEALEAANRAIQASKGNHMIDFYDPTEEEEKEEEEKVCIHTYTYTYEHPP